MADTRLYKVAITPKGKYVHGTEYDALCQVLYATADGGDGCSYISLKPNVNVRPGTDNTVWAICLEKGEKGSQGDPGSGFTDVDVTVDNTSGTPSGTAVIENDTLYLSISGIKGADGQDGADGTDGQDGSPGIAPIIGDNGNWWEWDANENDYVDTGVSSHGVDGQNGSDGVGFASVASPTPADGTVIITLSDGDTMTLDLNHNHPAYYSKVAETSNPSGGFLPDVVYSLGTLTGTITFTLAAAVTGNVNHYFWMFDTGSTAPTITWPTGITWADGSAPTVSASKHYEISVLGGIAYYSEV